MAKVLPFKGVHYAEGFDLDKVTAPPYDVISPDERARLAQLHPNNVVHVTLPEGDDRYSRAGQTLRRWLDEGVLIESASENVYVYRAEHAFGTTGGIICLIELERFGEGSVHPHEKTMPGPKADRLEIMRNTSANLEPLWFIAARDHPAIKSAVDQAEASPTLGEVTDREGVRHRIWTADPGLAQDLSSIELVVADGHHRYETALGYRDEQPKRGPWDYTLAFIGNPGSSAPLLRPTHRVVEGLTSEQLGRLVLLEPFEGTITEMAKHARPGVIGFAESERRWTFRSKGLDTQFLADLLDQAGAEPSYEHELEAVEKRVKSGSAVLLLSPVPISEVIEHALHGKTMPPKTTLFWPKPRSGLVLRLLSQA